MLRRNHECEASLRPPARKIELLEIERSNCHFDRECETPSEKAERGHGSGSALQNEILRSAQRGQAATEMRARAGARLSLSRDFARERRRSCVAQLNSRRCDALGLSSR